MSKESSKDIVSKHDLILLNTTLDILKDRKQLVWINFRAGLVRGFAGIIGAAIAIILIGFLVTKLGGIPIIGGFIKQIGDAVKTTK